MPATGKSCDGAAAREGHVVVVGLDEERGTGREGCHAPSYRSETQLPIIQLADLACERAGCDF
jgi:hypothetical protein